MATSKRLVSLRSAGLFLLVMGLSLLSPWSMMAGSASRGHTARADGVLDRPVHALKAPPARDSLGYVPGELLVKLDGATSLRAVGGGLTASSPELSDMLACYGFTSANEIAPGTYKLSAPGARGVDLAAAARDLQATGAVSYAGPNHLYYAMLTPND